MFMKGFVNILKPVGMTSSNAVVKLRGILKGFTGERFKVGHMGTLDPLASGVLPIAVGSATRLFDYMQDKIKEYRATFKFGITSDTLDMGGNSYEYAPANFTKNQLEAVLKEFTGDIIQLPPQYSAKSVGGRRAYDIARNGGYAELAPKTVKIYDITIADDKCASENEYGFIIRCGSGTYIRAIARDVAARLNTVGLMSSLVRTKSGIFDIKDAVTFEDFEKDPLQYIVSIEQALQDIAEFELPKQSVEKALNGVMMPFDLPNDDYFKVTVEGKVIAIGENIEGKLRLKTRL